MAQNLTDTSTATKRKRPTIPKHLRKSLKNWAEGARFTILEAHIEGFADARIRGWKAERAYLNKVCDEYHARISWRLLDHEEPPLPLPPYDPKVVADPEVLSGADQITKLERINVLNSVSQIYTLPDMMTESCPRESADG